MTNPDGSSPDQPAAQSDRPSIDFTKPMSGPTPTPATGTPQFGATPDYGAPQPNVSPYGGAPDGGQQYGQSGAPYVPPAQQYVPPAQQYGSPYGAQPMPSYGQPPMQQFGGYPGADAMAPFGRDPYTGEPLSDKSKVAAGLLQIFLGGFGVGRFYLGDNNTGAIMLGLTILGWVTSWLFVGLFIVLGVGIWALVDGIMILNGSVRDKQGRKLRS